MADVTTIIWETFLDKYQPIRNYIDKNAGYDGLMWEIYGEELNVVRKQPTRQIWTVLDCDGRLIIASGWHYVNRFGYILTSVPFNDEDAIEVIDD